MRIEALSACRGGWPMLLRQRDAFKMIAAGACCESARDQKEALLANASDALDKCRTSKSSFTDVRRFPSLLFARRAQKDRKPKRSPEKWQSQRRPAHEKGNTFWIDMGLTKAGFLAGLTPELSRTA